MYDETYSGMYEVIARKLRALLEPFSKYVEYLALASSEYITS